MAAASGFRALLPTLPLLRTAVINKLPPLRNGVAKTVEEHKIAVVPFKKFEGFVCLDRAALFEQMKSIPFQRNYKTPHGLSITGFQFLDMADFGEPDGGFRGLPPHNDTATTMSTVLREEGTDELIKLMGLSRLLPRAPIPDFVAPVVTAVFLHDTESKRLSFHRDPHESIAMLTVPGSFGYTSLNEVKTSHQYHPADESQYSGAIMDDLYRPIPVLARATEKDQKIFVMNQHDTVHNAIVTKNPGSEMSRYVVILCLDYLQSKA